MFHDRSVDSGKQMVCGPNVRIKNARASKYSKIPRLTVGARSSSWGTVHPEGTMGASRRHNVGIASMALHSQIAWSKEIASPRAAAKGRHPEP